MAKRTVELFTAGCAVCADALRIVQSIVCEGCDLQIHDMKSTAGAAKAKQYGVTRVPAVVVSGRLAGCCQQGGINESVLRGSAVVPTEALSKCLPFFAQMGGILGGLLCLIA